MDIWRDAYNRTHFPIKFGPQRVDDGLLELLTVRTAPQIPLGHMSKEAQAKSYDLDLREADALYMQIDGEPFYVEKPESVRLERANTVTLLRRGTESEAVSSEVQDSDVRVQQNSDSNIGGLEEKTPEEKMDNEYTV